MNGAPRWPHSQNERRRGTPCEIAQLPTAWVAEGLLMYIDPAAMAALLREAAEGSAPGSSFLAEVGTPLVFCTTCR
jgi:O-methyltransferase involved in polyketide biosynthesis